MYKKFFLFLFLLGSSLYAQCPIKAVIFDFGGVIATVDRSVLTEFLMNSFPISDEEAHKLLQTWYTHTHQGGSEEEFWNHYASTHQQKLPPDFLNSFERVQALSLRPYPETLAAIRQLKSSGFRVGLLSNVTPKHATLIRKLGYYDLFDPVLLSCDIHIEKPNPEAFHILLKTLQIPACEILFIDDQKVNVESAKSLGIQGIHLRRPDQIFSDLDCKGIHLENPFCPAALGS